MSERNGCVFCLNEDHSLPDGSSGAWCRYFQEPIKSDRRDPDFYAGEGRYPHSGRALGFQDLCRGFQLDPRQKARWDDLNRRGAFASSTSAGGQGKERGGGGDFSLSALIIGFVAFAILAIMVDNVFLANDDGSLVSAVLFVFALVVMVLDRLGKAGGVLVALGIAAFLASMLSGVIKFIQ